MTVCWAPPFGAVSPWPVPSELMAEPRSTASTGWPLRTASDRRSRTIRPTPSDHTVPSAAAEKGLHTPSADRARRPLKAMKFPGVDITDTPPASASEQSPVRSACAARWMATRELEAEVSTVSDGPCSPSR